VCLNESESHTQKIKQLVVGLVQLKFAQLLIWIDKILYGQRFIAVIQLSSRKHSLEGMLLTCKIYWNGCYSNWI